MMLFGDYRTCAACVQLALFFNPWQLTVRVSQKAPWRQYTKIMTK